MLETTKLAAVLHIYSIILEEAALKDDLLFAFEVFLGEWMKRFRQVEMFPAAHKTMLGEVSKEVTVLQEVRCQRKRKQGVNT